MSTASTSPVIPYDEGLVEEIAARLDLRAPNKEALHAIAQRFASSGGSHFEAICEIATAVGKTYLSAGVIEYLFEKGIRNLLIVVPGRTVLNKTIANFSPDNPKYVNGMEADYVLVTADNFNRGSIATTFNDETKLKLFVFTVQALLNPISDVERRTREFQEWIGLDLQGYLESRNDLVIVGDEHHVYASKAKAFNAAISELHPIGVIGLTATADTTQRQLIIYEYPLARALCDRLVKIPVLVGRTDNRNDLDTQLADGLSLLKAKQLAADVYQVTHSVSKVNAVMLVIAESIDQANQVGEILGRPNLLGDKASSEVLVIHSQSSDDALAQLAQVEEPDSPIKVIINVSMLKEGWDVKNIFVIVSLRPSVSETLTEQTLGRGLRLPYGKYTDEEILDTLEVLTHSQYERLLTEAGILIRGLSSVRASIETTVSAGNFPVAAQVLPPAASPNAPLTQVSPEPQQVEQASVNEIFGAGLSGVVVMQTQSRIDQLTQEASSAFAVPVIGGREVQLPRVTRTTSVPNFQLSSIDNSVFSEIGAKFASQHQIKLDRKILDVVDDGEGKFTLSPRQAETLDAVPASLPLGEIKTFLVDVILQMDIVANDAAARNGANRLVDAAIAAAGGEENLATYHESAAAIITRTIKGLFRVAPQTTSETFEMFTYTVPRTCSKTKNRNRFSGFSKDDAYGPWEKSSYEWNWFDSSPELRLANTIDSDIHGDGVEYWCRILRFEGFSIEWSGGSYTPDFYARIGDVNHLIEVKADNEMQAQDVVAKKEASNRLARALTDSGLLGTWKYTLVSQTDVETFTGVQELLKY
jgi:type III restriction enzyme